MMLQVDLDNAEVITIPSAGNVADAPSRGKPVEEEKRAATWKVVQEYKKGRVSNANLEQNPYHPTRSDSETQNGGNGLRHYEAEDDEAWCATMLEEPELTTERSVHE